jgi:hypothetical protein
MAARQQGQGNFPAQENYLKMMRFELSCRAYFSLCEKNCLIKIVVSKMNCVRSEKLLCVVI